jgi:hypothetical protein
MSETWINSFPDMAAVVPQSAKGCASVQHLTIDAPSGRTISWAYGEFKTPSPAGTYATLRIANNDGKPQVVMMSDFYYERETCEEVVKRAHGDVLIAGLGLGMILHPILAKPEVRSVTVIEKYQDVVDLISPTLPADPRLTITTADIFEWQPSNGRLYDIIWFDIWPDIEASRLPEMRELRRRFLPYWNDSNPKSWMESWHRRETLEGLWREKLLKMKTRAVAADKSNTDSSQSPVPPTPVGAMSADVCSENSHAT